MTYSDLVGYLSKLFNTMLQGKTGNLLSLGTRGCKSFLTSNPQEQRIYFKIHIVLTKFSKAVKIYDLKVQLTERIG